MPKSSLPLALGLSLLATQAFAHARLVRAEPAVGATVDHSPAQLRLEFSEFPRLPGTGAQLTFPDGRRTLLTLARDPGDRQAVSAPLPPSLPPGRYLVSWHALSPNAHHSKGVFSFTVTR